MDQKRKDFPLFLSQPITYLDNAATTQKPKSVIDALVRFYTCQNAPIHRAVYKLAEEATQLYEEARSTVARFLSASSDEIVFTKGTTEGINFICSTWAEQNLHTGDEIIITELEHHANMIPWIRLSQRKGITLKYIPIHSDGTLDYVQYISMITAKTKLVAFTACSNALGTYVDKELISSYARQVGAKVLIDAAQIAGRETIVAEAYADFLVFSGHKMLGPTGIGVLYMSQAMHDSIDPYQVGGGMVFNVDFHKATWLKAPRKYEAGTPPVAEAIGLQAAIEYLEQLSFTALRTHEARLCTKLVEALAHIPSITILSPLDQVVERGHIVTFVSDRFHAHDIAAYLDTYNICVRAGNHCAQPLHKKLGNNSSVRVSFYLYNTEEEVEYLIEALQKLLVK